MYQKVAFYNTFVKKLSQLKSIYTYYKELLEYLIDFN